MIEFVLDRVRMGKRWDVPYCVGKWTALVMVAASPLRYVMSDG